MAPSFNDQCGLFGQIAVFGNTMNCRKKCRCSGVIAEKDSRPGEDAIMAHRAKAKREGISQNQGQRRYKIMIHP